MNREDDLDFLDENQKLREQFDEKEFEEKPKGWLIDKEYTGPDEVVSDILYLTAEYENERLSPTELDQYFYKRQYLQDQLKRLSAEDYADEYVLVDNFNNIRRRLKYDPDAEKLVTELAAQIDCYVVLKKGSRYFAEVGDEIVEMGEAPDVGMMEEEFI